MHSRLINFFIRSAACAFATFCADSTLATEEKICGDQRPLFQCQVQGGKNLALCSSYIDGELNGIQYRFGRETKKELIFPASGFDLISFTSNHFTRFRTDYRRIKFSIDNYTYSIYSDYDGENLEDPVSAGGVVIFSSAEASPIQLPCTHLYIDKLNEILPHLKCDTSDALGCQ